MKEGTLAFIIWCIIGILFILLGICALVSKKETAFGFWANAKTVPVEDVKGYNRAIGKLWMAFGVIFVILGIPLLEGENSPFIIVTILGTMLEVIGVMGVYILGIEKKYRKRI